MSGNSIAAVGGGVKNLAIGAAVLLGVVTVIYVAVKAKKAVAAVGTAVNPVDPENLANRAVTAAIRGITGDKDQTLGGLIYDFFHKDEAQAATAPTPYRTDGAAPQVRK